MASPARSSLAGSSCPRRSICACISMVDSGVRSSCDSVARNWSLARLARSASRLRLLRVADVVLERVDVDERQDGAVDLVVGRLVGPDLHPVPAAVRSWTSDSCIDDRLDHLGDLLVQVGHLDVRPDVVERAAHVGGQDVQDAARLAA